ncbi:F-box protein SKIP14 [Linum perenne]
MSWDSFCDSWRFKNFDLNVEKSPHYQHQSQSDDIVDQLPVDPFGMDEIKFRLNAVSWFGVVGSDGLITGFDWFLKDGMRRQTSLDSKPSKEKMIEEGERKNEVSEPHEGLFYALAYLRVNELLEVERVCKSLCEAVRDNSLLWRNICIDQPLSERITDDALNKLANRAQGTLQSLTLVGCTKISDSGLMQVLQTNPSLQKLSVPRCLRLTVDGIVGNLRVLKCAGNLKLKHLKFGSIFGVTDQQFDQLCSILGAEEQMYMMSSKKPQFFHVDQLYISWDDDCAFDIERCPKCQKMKLVYDCPLEDCHQMNDDGANQLCKACAQCIPRCIHCGQCIRDRDYEETFTLDHLCLVCRKPTSELHRKRIDT